MTKTKSQSHFRNSFNSEEVDTDAISECSTNPSIENNEILDQTNQTTNDTTFTLDGTTDKDTHGSDEVNEDTVTVDKEPEEPLKGSEIDGKENEQDIENNEDECVEKGMKFFCPILLSVIFKSNCLCFFQMLKTKRKQRKRWMIWMKMNLIT